MGARVRGLRRIPRPLTRLPRSPERPAVYPRRRWRVRAAKGARLESVCGGNSTVGSNPTATACVMSQDIEDTRAQHHVSPGVLTGEPDPTSCSSLSRCCAQIPRSPSKRPPRLVPRSRQRDPGWSDCAGALSQDACRWRPRVMAQRGSSLASSRPRRSPVPRLAFAAVPSPGSPSPHVWGAFGLVPEQAGGISRMAPTWQPKRGQLADWAAGRVTSG